MSKVDKRILKYREKLDKLGLKWEEVASLAQLKAILDSAVKGASKEVDDEIENEVALEGAMKQADDFISVKMAAMEKELAEMKQLIKGASGGQQAALTPEMVYALVQSGKTEVQDGLVDPSFIKPEDEMEKEEVFFRYGPTHNIFHGWKAGVKIPVPYGVKFIKFEQSAGWVTRTGSGLQQRRVSVYITKNRKLSEFIKSLHEFGKTIHLDREKAFNSTVTGRYMDLYNMQFQSLQGQPMHVLAKMASEMGISTPMGASHHDYSVQIAESLALGSMQGESQAFESQMRSLQIDKNLLANPAQ